MTQPRTRKPSAAETAILSVLWERQPCSIREVHAKLCETKEVGYTTTLKQVQRMEDKGFVIREPGEGKSFKYRAVASEADTKSALFDRFVENAFGNSVGDLVMHALGNEKTSPAELEAIRDFIAKLDKT